VELLKGSSALDDQLAPLTQPNSDAQLIVKLRKARAMRRARNFVESVNALQEVLAGRRNLMEAQVEAAATLADRAQTNKEVLMFDRAIKGSRPDEKGDNIIWGWLRIADTMRRVPQFVPPEQPAAPPAGATPEQLKAHQDALAKYNDDMIQHKAFVELFHVGRYNAALNYYQHALLSDKADERKKLLNSVTYTINNTKDLAADMGGAEWKAKYDDLTAKATKALAQ
jgi:tetratricopeptide (TPR) repeat protein